MEIRSENEDIDSVELYDEEGNYIGTNVISKKMGDFAIKGIVIFSNGEKYEWKWPFLFFKCSAHFFHLLVLRLILPLLL